MNPNPGEFFAPIQAGLFRGIPAIHIVESPEQSPIEDLPRMIAGAIAFFGLGYPGKAYLYVSREVPPELLIDARKSGLFVVGDADLDNRSGWTAQCHHLIRSSTTCPTTPIDDCDCFVYIPDVVEPFSEPSFHHKFETVPKFLYVPTHTNNILRFFANTQYVWALQIYKDYPFKIVVPKEEPKA